MLYKDKVKYISMLLYKHKVIKLYNILYIKLYNMLYKYIISLVISTLKNKRLYKVIILL